MASVSNSPHELCDASVDFVLRNVNTIQYLIQSIEKITQQPFLRSRIKCISSSPLPSTKSSSAGYMWRSVPHQRVMKGDIVLLEDQLVKTANKNFFEKELNPETLETSFKSVLHQVEKDLRHELVHAFDDARGEVDPYDCFHQACSEIRAARLSGDCFVNEEAKKMRWNLFAGGKECVRRRAVLAVETNPICRGFSDRAVEKMFPRCYFDYEPFAAPIYAMGSYGTQTFPNSTLS